MAPINERNKLLGFNNSYAFIIGINKYPFINGNLTSALPDARRLSSILKEEQGFEHVELLEDIDRATFSSLLERIKNPAQEPIITENDSIVFYYAGHGKPGEFDEGPAGYILPSDAKPSHAQLENDSLIPMEDIFETLKVVNCRHTLLILDCCFAGKFRQVGVKSRDTRRLTRVPLYPERFERYKTRKAWQVLVSAGQDQTAADWMGDRDDANEDSVHSPFARALFEALEGEADLKQKGKNLGDGVLTSNELFIYLWDKVERATKKNPRFKTQHPDLFPMGNHEGGEFIFFDPKNALNFAVRKKRNPYKGLKAFEPEDYDLFFGRKKQIDKILGKLEKSNFLIVSAPSGFGKTSLIKAGVFPKLEESNGYELTVFQPGPKPNSEWDALGFKLGDNKHQILLLDQFERLFTECEDEREREDFERDLKDLFIRIRRNRNQNTKVIFTIRSDFEWQLKAADFAILFWNKDKIQDFFFRVPPMILDELKEALLEPALVETFDFESEELINHILEEVSYAPGALPLMSFGMHALAKLTDLDKRVFTFNNYKDVLGGISGALSKKVDGIYHGLKEKEQETLRKIMLRMVNLKDGTYIRRQVPIRIDLQQDNNVVSELDFPSDDKDKIVTRVLKLLADESLIIHGTDTKKQPYVEPIHNALINFWPKCLKWIQNFGDDQLILQRRLWGAATKGYQLWHDDPNIEELYKLSQSQNHWFNQAEYNFIVASWDKHQNQIETLKRQRDEARSSALAAKALLSYQDDHTAGLELAFQAFETCAFDESVSALHEILSNPDSQFVQYLGPPDLITQLPEQASAMAISKLGDIIVTGHVNGFIHIWQNGKSTPGQSLQLKGQPVLHLTLSADDQYLYASSGTKSGIVYHLNNSLQFTLEDTGVQSFGKGDFVKHSSQIMTVVNDLEVAIWDTKTGTLLRLLKEKPKPIHASTGQVDYGNYDQEEDEIYADSDMFESIMQEMAMNESMMSSMDTGEEKVDESLTKEVLHTIGMNREGRYVGYFHFYDGPYVVEWDQDGNQTSRNYLFEIKKDVGLDGMHFLMKLQNNPEAVFRMARNADCSYLVTCHLNGRIKLRDVSNKKIKKIGAEYGLFDLRGMKDISKISFAFDSNLVIALSEDNEISIWDAETGRLVYQINDSESKSIQSGNKNNRKRIIDVQCSYTSKQGTWAHAIREDQTLLSWELPMDINVHHVHEGGILHIQLNDAGTHYLASSMDGSVSIHEIKIQKEIWKVQMEENPCVTSAFSIESQWVALYCVEDGIHFWDYGKEQHQFYQDEAFKDQIITLQFVGSRLHISVNYELHQVLNIPSFESVFKVYQKEQEKLRKEMQELKNIMVLSGHHHRNKYLQEKVTREYLKRFADSFKDNFQWKSFWESYGKISDIQISQDGKYGAIVVPQKRFEFWDIEKHVLLHEMNDQVGLIVDMKFDPFGLLISLTMKGALQIWDVRNGLLLQSIQTDPSLSIAINTSGSKIYIGSGKGIIYCHRHLIGQHHIQKIAAQKKKENEEATAAEEAKKSMEGFRLF